MAKGTNGVVNLPRPCLAEGIDRKHIYAGLNRTRVTAPCHHAAEDTNTASRDIRIRLNRQLTKVLCMSLRSSVLTVPLQYRFSFQEIQANEKDVSSGMATLIASLESNMPHYVIENVYSLNSCGIAFGAPWSHAPQFCDCLVSTPNCATNNNGLRRCSPVTYALF